MSDNMISRSNRMKKDMVKEPKPLKSSFSEGTSAEPTMKNDEWSNEGFTFSDEETYENNGGLGKKTECRICHEDDFIENMEAPCACNGSLKLAHRKCIQQWCNEKKNTICEICHQPYADGYIVADETVIEINENSYDYNGNPSIAHVLTIDEDPDNMLAYGYNRFDECGTPTGVKIAIIRVVVLVSAAIMMLKHAYDQVEDDNNGRRSIVSVMASEQIFFVRIMSFMMPVYAVLWIINFFIRRRERREAETRVVVSNNARGLAAATIAHRRSTVTIDVQASSHMLSVN